MCKISPGQILHLFQGENLYDWINLFMERYLVRKKLNNFKSQSNPTFFIYESPVKYYLDGKNSYFPLKKCPKRICLSKTDLKACLVKYTL